MKEKQHAYPSLQSRLLQRSFSYALRSGSPATCTSTQEHCWEEASAHTTAKDLSLVQCRQMTGWPGKHHLLVFSIDGKKLLLKKARRSLRLHFSGPQDKVNHKQNSNQNTLSLLPALLELLLVTAFQQAPQTLTHGQLHPAAKPFPNSITHCRGVIYHQAFDKHFGR